MTETKIEKIIFTFRELESLEGQWQIKFAEEVAYQETKISGLILPKKINWSNFSESKPALKQDEQFIARVTENNCQIQETTEGRFLSILNEKEFSWEEVDKIEEAAKSSNEANAANPEGRRNIILIGRTGNGKSTLANVICGENKFQEGEFGASQTQEIQVEEFENGGKTYRIIDTVGIGDTKLSPQEVLNKLAAAAYQVREGLHQILFVTKGRFTEEERETYNLLRSVIFDEEITKYTTIVYTGFPNFQDPKKCAKNKELLKENNKEMAEIIESCGEKIIHVSNPPIDLEDEDEVELGLKKRAKSRTVLLTYLHKLCMGIEKPYKPKNLDELNDKIKNYMTEKELLQKQLDEMKNLSEEQRKALQKEIANLQEQIALQTQQFLQKKGWFQKAGAVIGEGVDNTIEVAGKVIGVVGEAVGNTVERVLIRPIDKLVDNCRIM